MTRHRRIPAFVAIGLTVLVGLGLFAATGQFRSTDLAHATLAELEEKAFGSTDADVWLAYGDKLRAAARFDDAAKAYARSIDLQQADGDARAAADARLKEGMALGQGANADAFFTYVGRLTMNYPKLAVDLLERPEVSGMRGDPRWEPTKSAAQAQAVD